MTGSARTGSGWAGGLVAGVDSGTPLRSDLHCSQNSAPSSFWKWQNGHRIMVPILTARNDSRTGSGVDGRARPSSLPLPPRKRKNKPAASRHGPSGLPDPTPPPTPSPKRRGGAEGLSPPLRSRDGAGGEGLD